jgi:hypothetical protein
VRGLPVGPICARQAQLEGVDEAFFQPAAQFRPLMHVVAVLADDLRDLADGQVQIVALARTLSFAAADRAPVSFLLACFFQVAAAPCAFP